MRDVARYEAKEPPACSGRSITAARSAVSSDLYPPFRSRLYCQPCPALSRPSNLRCRSPHCHCWRRRCCHSQRWSQRSRSSLRRRYAAAIVAAAIAVTRAGSAVASARAPASVAKDLRLVAFLRVEHVACVSRIEVCATNVGPGAMFLGRSGLGFAKSLQREARPRTSLLSRDRGS
jgi:hypothetical protein